MNMISPEEAQQLILDNVKPLDYEVVNLLDATNRAAAQDLTSDIDVSPFDHSAMDGYALYASDLEGASPENPVILEVLDEIPAGYTYDGEIKHGQCVRIMTGAPMPKGVDSVVKFEIVTTVDGSGKTDGHVSFEAPTQFESNVRKAGEEAKAGEVIVRRGEVIGAAGIGFLAGCGVLEVPVFRKPKVAIIAIGSELVEPPAVPGPGQIRNSNSYAMAACARQAGCDPDVLPVVVDDEDLLAAAIAEATKSYDFIITTGGASNGDFDFIKPVVERLGTLLMTTVNMRPGKAQTFGIVNGTPVFGLPGNPAAAYMGFELLIRPALRKMQGRTNFFRPVVKARLATDKKKKDTRRLYMRATLTKAEDGVLEAMPAKNQSSGLFGVIQKSNCVAIVPEDVTFMAKGDMIDCIFLDVTEEIVLPEH